MPKAKEIIKFHSKSLLNLFKQKKTQILFFLLIVFNLAFLSLTKLVYPFNMLFEDFSDVFLSFFDIKITVVRIFTILYYLFSSLLLVISFFFSNSKKDEVFFTLLIIFSIRILGSLSQNMIYHNDDIVHVGIISNIINNNFDGTTWNGDPAINYSFLLLHRFLALFGIIFNIKPMAIVLYIFPVVAMIFQYPLLVKFRNLVENKYKFFFVSIATFCFPFADRLWFGLTPYLFLTFLFATLISLYPFETKKSIIFALLITIIALSIHIHGFLFIPLFAFLYIDSHLDSNKKRIFLLGIFISIFFAAIAFLFLIYSIVEISELSPIYEILFKLTRPIGDWALLYLPKISAGGLYLFWYLIQLLFVIAVLVSSCFLIYHLCKEKNNLISIKERMLFLFSSLSIFFSVIFFWSLFLSYSIRLSRFYFFIIITGIYVLIETIDLVFFKLNKNERIKPFFNHFIRLYNKQGKKVKIYLFFGFFILILLIQFVAYYQFVPYNNYEIEAIEWIDDNIVMQDDFALLTSLSFAKLCFGIKDIKKVVVWEHYWEKHVNDTNLKILNITSKVFNYYHDTKLSHLLVPETEVILFYKITGINITVLTTAWTQANIIQEVYRNYGVVIYKYMGR